MRINVAKGGKLTREAKEVNLLDDDSAVLTITHLGEITQVRE
jgi:hypothetical protein